jgi:hypothetical protein
LSLCCTTPLVNMAVAPKEETIRANWKCFLACGVMILSPFQYGVDFGLIGGLQAMPGFLKVSLEPRLTGSPVVSAVYPVAP